MATDSLKAFRTVNFGQGRAYLVHDQNIIREIQEQVVQKARVKLYNGNKYYKMFEETDLQALRALPHMVTFGLNKRPGYLYLFKHRGRPTCIYIREKQCDRQDTRKQSDTRGDTGDVKGDGQSTGQERPKALEKDWEYIMVRHRFNESLYNGTLFQGEFVQINKFQYLFLINDLLMKRGRAFLVELPEKIKQMQSIFKDQFTADPGLDTHQIMLKEYCDYDQLEDFFTSYRMTLSYQAQITSLIFRPHVRNQKNITVVLNRPGFHRNLPDFEKYIRTEKRSKETGSEDQTESDEPFTPALASLVSAAALAKGKRKKINSEKHPCVFFRMVQTNKPDVYELWLRDHDKKYGIASIPTVALSQTVQSWFADSKEHIVKAEHVKTFNKWQPVCIAEDGTMANSMTELI